MHRADAWGVAIVLGVVAMLLHSAFGAPGCALTATLSFAYLFGYLVNDYFDAPEDARDVQGEHRNLFVLHPVSQTFARVAFGLSAAVVLAGFLTFGRAGLMWFGMSIAVIWSYSAPPVRLKSRPGLDLVTHAVFVQTYPYLLFLVLLELDITALDYFILAVCFLSSLSGQLAQQIRDYQVDLLTGATFTTRWGLRPARYLLSAITLALGAVVLAGFLFGLMPLTLLPFVVLFVPVFLMRIRGVGRTSRAYAVWSVVTALGYIAWLAYARVDIGGTPL
ncbi:MAG: UbiA family prenyltransferase [Gammaproteobacteria bacterium]